MNRRNLSRGVRTVAAILACVPSISGSRAEGGNKESKPMMTLTSPAFSAGKPIPTKFTCDGADVSPSLHWQGVPEGTKSLVLICDDPDAPVGTWVHWVLYDLPATAMELAEKIASTDTLPNGAKQGVN